LRILLENYNFDLQRFVDRIEAQLKGADKLPIRKLTNEVYEKIGNTMFEILQHMAQDQEANAQAQIDAEDKDQLNYHVILIGQ
jgi:exocyst complex component 1